MSIVVEYFLDHDMDIPVVNGMLDVDVAERKLKERLDCKRWQIEIDRESHRCDIEDDNGFTVHIYPCTMMVDAFPDDWCIGPYSWLGYVDRYFEERDPETRKRTHDVILKLKELFKAFNPTTFVAMGDNMGFDVFCDCLEEGQSFLEALKPSGHFEKEMIDSWSCWPKGIRMMSEKDEEHVDPNTEYCTILYQPLDEII